MQPNVGAGQGRLRFTLLEVRVSETHLDSDGKRSTTP